MKRPAIWLALGLILTLIVVGAACSSDDEPSDTSVDTPVDTPADTAPAPADPESVARGGAMYDKWWKIADGATEPTGDMPVWAAQSSNTRSGADTWRCKECHGWDYEGVDGAYSSGSHKTGFAGVLNAGDSNSAAELVAILKGGDNADHDFSSVLSDADLEDLANFINEGLISHAPLIDYDLKEPIGADLANGETLFTATCSVCHGSDGILIDFHEGTGVTGVANDNPWETLHKIRFGNPGTGMPQTYLLDWSLQDQVDVLGYAQTLLDADPESIARGGAMYDKWWAVADGATEPTEDQALWATQSSNTRSGKDTWRCKECHGWDYEGADGAYASGSHYTGFPGVLSAGDSNTAAELLAILKGGNNADHDFSSVLSDADLEDLANFINEGLVDHAPLIDYAAKAPIGADLANGESLYAATCAVCHGSDGILIDFHEGTGVTGVANDNPWETLHKIRFGNPGTGMPQTYLLDWSLQDQVDVLGYAQTLLD